MLMSPTSQNASRNINTSVGTINKKWIGLPVSPVRDNSSYGTVVKGSKLRVRPKETSLPSPIRNYLFSDALSP